MLNKNRVQLIIIGIDITNLNSQSVIVDKTNTLPTKEILPEETIEKCRDNLFQEIIGYSSDWAQLKLIDTFKIGEGITIVYGGAVGTEIKLLQEHKFQPISDVRPASIGEHNYSLIYKTLQQRF